MTNENITTPPEEGWHPPMRLRTESMETDQTANNPDKPAHPPELRFADVGKRHSGLISSLRNSDLPLYDSLMREVLCDVLTAFDEEIHGLQMRLCYFENVNAVTQKDLMTTKELSLYIGLKPKTIWNLKSMGVIPCHKKGHLYFRRSEIDEWILGYKPTKWDEMGVKPGSIPVDFNQTMELMKQRLKNDK